MIKKILNQNNKIEYLIDSSVFQKLHGIGEKSATTTTLVKITPQTLLTIMSNDQKDRIAIVNTLNNNSFLGSASTKQSTNVSFYGPEFINDRKIKSHDLIILYCANYTCSASKSYQEKLISKIPECSSRIMLYEGGTYEWGYLALQHPDLYCIRDHSQNVISQTKIINLIEKNNHWDEIKKGKKVNPVLMRDFNKPNLNLTFSKTDQGKGLLDGKICVVTGGTSGLGLQTVITMLQHGAKHVTLTYFHNDKRANQVYKMLKEKFSEEQFYVLKADARTVKGNNMTFASKNRKTFAKDYVGVDCVCLNAGIFGPANFNQKHVHNISENDWDKVMNTNLKGVFFGIQEFIKQVQMNEINDGTVVCIKSIYGSTGSLFSNIAYQTSKHGVMGLVRQTAITCARPNDKLNIKFPIRINAVSPTFTKTNLTKPMFEENAIKKIIEEENPIKGFAEKQDVANAVIYLLSEISGSITGSDLPVDRGTLAESIPSVFNVLNLNDKDIELLSCCGNTT